MKDPTREIQRRLRRARYPVAVRVLLDVPAILTIAVTLVCFAEIAVRLARLAPPPFDVSEAQRVCEEAVAELNDQFETDAFAYDPWLLWRLRPGSWLIGHRVTRDGFLAVDNVSPPSDKSAELVLVVGDSLPCVAYRTFPEVAVRLLQDSGVRRPLCLINAAVPGYSTEQVRRFLAQRPEMRPAVVVVCVGLADSSLSWGVEDFFLGSPSPVAQWMLRHFWWSHLVRWLTLGRPLGTHRESNSPVRVPPARFEANASAIIEKAHQLGAKAVLVTQPVEGAAAPRLASFQETTSGSETSRRWRGLYNDILRRVAFETGAELIDLDQEVRCRASDVLLASDGTHLSPAGHNLAARLLLRALNRAGMLSAEELALVAEGARYDTTYPDAPRVLWQLGSHLAEKTTAARDLTLGLLAVNRGNTIWLSRNTVARLGRRTHVPIGSTSIVANWLGGKHISEGWGAALQRFPLPHDVFPGEATSQTLTVRLPQEGGVFTLLLGLEAEGVGLLSWYGAEETSLTVTVR